MQRRLMLKLVGMAWLLSACVTINVYFPAAAAEKAADKIIEDVWGGKGANKSSDTRSPDKNTQPTSQRRAEHSTNRVLLAAANALNFLVSPAEAAADLNISTPAIRQLTQSMEARHAQLKPYYDSGAVGLTNDGLVELRDLNLVPLPERTQARKLVADENGDRSNLYREIAAGNGHPEWEKDIRGTFAQRWIQRAASGWYYNDGSGWKKK